MAHTCLCTRPGHHQAAWNTIRPCMHAGRASGTQARSHINGQVQCQACGRQAAIRCPACLAPALACTVRDLLGLHCTVSARLLTTYCCCCKRRRSSAMPGLRSSAMPGLRSSAMPGLRSSAICSLRASVASALAPAVGLYCVPQQHSKAAWRGMKRLGAATASSQHRARGTVMLPGWWSEQRRC
jgi:hypothetical protein